MRCIFSMLGFEISTLCYSFPLCNKLQTRHLSPYKPFTWNQRNCYSGVHVALQSLKERSCSLKHFFRGLSCPLRLSSSLFLIQSFQLSPHPRSVGEHLDCPWIRQNTHLKSQKICSHSLISSMNMDGYGLKEFTDKFDLRLTSGPP